MSKKILLSIINWNNSHLTNRCLASIANIPLDNQPDVVLIDNGSNIEPISVDESVVKKLKSFELIKNSKNIGFAGGHNYSIKLASSKGYGYVCILNNDTEVLDTTMFDSLRDVLNKNKKAVAVAPTVLSRLNPDTVWYGGGSMNLGKALTSHNNLGSPFSKVRDLDTQKTDFITGCCVLMKLGHMPIDELLFDDTYFVYFEDADWCARMSNMGHELLWLPNKGLLHKTSSSLGIRSPAYAYYIVRNRIIFGKKWQSNFLLFRSLWVALKIFGLSLKKPSTTLKTLRALVYGIYDGYRKKGGEIAL